MRLIPIALAALVLGAAPAAFAGGTGSPAPGGAAPAGAGWAATHGAAGVALASLLPLRHGIASRASLYATDPQTGAGSAGVTVAGSAGAAMPSGESTGPWSDRMPVADEVIVRKSERRLFLMRDGHVLRSFHVELGLDPTGAKREAGDFRTPEGHYELTRRNPQSHYFMSIQVSYPNATDMELAHRDHVDPGGSIMIHGMPNELRYPPAYYSEEDWTDGCIALSDADMVAVWLMTRPDTPILILP